MNIQRYAKRDIALSQIETALRLYAGKGDLFSVITLAGAAEEILGELLRPAGAAALFAPLFQFLRPRSRSLEEREPASFAETDSFIHTDPQHEAVFLLGRAIDDYQAVSGTLTPSMARFNEQVRGIKPSPPSS